MASIGNVLAGPSGFLIYARQTNGNEDHGEINRFYGRLGLGTRLRGFDLFCRAIGGRERRLTNHHRSSRFGGGLFYISASPDGRYVAFHCNLKHQVVFYENKTPLWIMNLRNKSIRRVFADQTVDEYYWSPKGTRLVAATHNESGESVSIIDPSFERRSVPMRIPHWATQWGVDYRDRLVFAHAKWPITFSIAGLEGDSGSWDADPAEAVIQPDFSPNGKTAVALTEGRLWLGENLTFAQMDEGDFGRFGNVTVGWSPNGQFVYVLSALPTEDPTYATHQRSEILVYDSIRAKPIRCAITWKGDVNPPQFEVLGWYDNRTLVLQENEVGKKTIWRYSLNGSRQKLCTLEGEVSEVAWVHGRCPS